MISTRKSVSDELYQIKKESKRKDGKLKLMTILGTRPEIIRLSATIKNVIST